MSIGDRPSYLAYLVSEGSPKKAGTFCMSLSLQEEKHYNQIFPAATIFIQKLPKRCKSEGGWYYCWRHDRPWRVRGRGRRRGGASGSSNFFTCEKQTNKKTPQHLVPKPCSRLKYLTNYWWSLWWSLYSSSRANIKSEFKLIQDFVLWNIYGISDIPNSLNCALALIKKC